MLHSLHPRLVQTGVAAAAILLAASAAPIQAHPAPSSTTANAAAIAQPPARTAAPSDRRICVRLAQSSTRIARRICKTQAQWDREGGVPTND